MNKPFCNTCLAPIDMSTDGPAQRHSVAFAGQQNVKNKSVEQLPRLTLHPWDEQAAKSPAAIHFCSFRCQQDYVYSWLEEASARHVSPAPEAATTAEREP